MDESRHAPKLIRTERFRSRVEPVNKFSKLTLKRNRRKPSPVVVQTPGDFAGWDKVEDMRRQMKPVEVSNEENAMALDAGSVGHRETADEAGNR